MWASVSGWDGGRELVESTWSGEDIVKSERERRSRRHDDFGKAQLVLGRQLFAGSTVQA